MSRAARFLLPLGVCLALAAPAGALTAVISAPDGLTVSIHETTPVSVPGRFGGALTETIGGGLAYEVRRSDGHSWHGTIPGTQDLPGDFGPSLACHPVTGDVLLAFVSRAPGAGFLDGTVSLTTWLGQAWSDPVPAASVAHGASPVLVFRPEGDSFLLWRAPTLLGERLYLRHAERTAAGEGILWSYSDLGNPWTHFAQSGAGADPSRLRMLVATEGGTDLVHVILHDTGTRRTVVLSIEARTLSEGGDGTTGAAPVPVSFCRGDTPLAEHAGNVGNAASGPDGQRRDAWHLLAERVEAFYWLASDRLVVHVPRPALASSVLVLPRPTHDLQAPAIVLRALRAHLGRGQRPSDELVAHAERRSRR